MLGLDYGVKTQAQCSLMLGNVYAASLPNNGTARFEKRKQLLEYQQYLLLRDIWLIKF